jgi:NADPH-dependent 2,4-dienoyl-CoA reductase/sulfur reductase-like enzyme
MYTPGSRKNIIVIGGNAAGPAAAAKAKRSAPDANVLMIESGEFISTGTCELPYVLSGEIKGHEEIVFFNSGSFEKEKGVRVLTSHPVERIDRSKRIIIVRNLKSGDKFEQEYDRLILCTGSRAKTLPALPQTMENVFTLKSVADLIRIKSSLATNKFRNVLIIGAGYIGLEAADSLKSLGLHVTFLDKEKLPMPGAEEETRNLIAALIKENGIEYLVASPEMKFNHDSRKFHSIKLEGRILEFDLVLTAIGFEPNSGLAISSKLSTGRSGGIRIDRKMRTDDPNIFAAGDCCEIINRITGKEDYLPLATIAQKGGHIAGENAAGGNSFFEPAVKNIAARFFGKSYVAAGISSGEAKAHGFSYSTVNSVMPNLIKVMPESDQIFGKIIFDRNSRLILGANFLGGKEAVSYGDIISVFIHNRIRASELAKINFNYTPPLSPFINILSVLGRKIEKDLR